MRVTSQLADMDMEIGSITRAGDRIVVQTAPGTGIETRIEIEPRDAARILGLALRNPRIIAFMFALPLLCRRARAQPRPPDPQNPWSQP
ncbi:MAG TPA: hypothetical protein VMT66_01275 [Steroidobacteraceae bacterium]|nr:hypothetical protein [Steroidobacteraceae bacterium]